MPSDIYFASDHARVTVDEEPAQVAEAFTSAHGLPFRLSGQGGRGEVYVNPAMVAFWSAAEPSREPELEQEPPPTRQKGVTDLWGKPPRRKPRR